MLRRGCVAVLMDSAAASLPPEFSSLGTAPSLLMPMLGRRGLAPCMLGIIPYAGLDITLFEVAKEHLRDHYGGPPPPQMLVFTGMVSSSFAQSVAYPLGVVRTRLAVRPQAWVQWPGLQWTITSYNLLVLQPMRPSSCRQCRKR